MNKHEWNGEGINYAQYIKCIENTLKLNEEEWNFKSDTEYNKILEHLIYDDACVYLEKIKSSFNKFYNENKELIINICKKNDSIGNPIKYNFTDFIE